MLLLLGLLLLLYELLLLRLYHYLRLINNSALRLVILRRSINVTLRLIVSTHHSLLRHMTWHLFWGLDNRHHVLNLLLRLNYLREPLGWVVMRCYVWISLNHLLRMNHHVRHYHSWVCTTLSIKWLRSTFLVLSRIILSWHLDILILLRNIWLSCSCLFNISIRWIQSSKKI